MGAAAEDRTRTLLIYGFAALLVLCVTLLAGMKLLEAQFLRSFYTDVFVGMMAFNVRSPGTGHLVPPGTSGSVLPIWVLLPLVMLLGGCGCLSGAGTLIGPYVVLMLALSLWLGWRRLGRGRRV